VSHDGLVRPRDWLVNPDQFGRTAKARWKPATDFLTAAELADRSAAYLQHMFACNVAEVLREDVLTIADVARTADVNAGSLGHVMRGRHALTLATMIGVVIALGRVDLFPAPASLDEVQPG
jgi:hypothetical protein